MFPRSVARFLQTKIRAIGARARRLSSLSPESVGLRNEDKPYAPGKAHFRAANIRLQTIDADIVRRLRYVRSKWLNGTTENVLVLLALVEKEIDRARRAFGLFFDVFSQRGCGFAPVLSAHDTIARDCYQIVGRTVPHLFRWQLLKPITYMDHGYSPATMRREVNLKRLLGERNPFPLIRIPWDRDNPWQAVFLHEVGHNLQADLGIWHENKKAVKNRMLFYTGDVHLSKVYERWHKEIFADLIALLLGGPATVWGAMDFLAHPSPKIMTHKAGGVHPTGYLRVLIMIELLRRMGFVETAVAAKKIWEGLYNPARGHRIPQRILSTSGSVIPQVVDEIVFQPRRNLGYRALKDIVPFTREDERRIRKGAELLVRKVLPEELPPRFLVSASRYAMMGGRPLTEISRQVISHLSNKAAPIRKAPVLVRAVAGGRK